MRIAALATGALRESIVAKELHLPDGGDMIANATI
jgi:hypothetical protein